MQAGPGFLLTFIYYFATTAMALTVVVAQATGLEVSTGIPQQVGALGGALAGLAGVYFNRSVSLTVPFADRKKFLKQLNELLTPLNYHLYSEGDDIQIYERSGLNKWLSGRVFVKLEQKEATIASRAVVMRQLEPQIQAGTLGDRINTLKKSRTTLE
jgi:hypothetical protein